MVLLKILMVQFRRKMLHKGRCLRNCSEQTCTKIEDELADGICADKKADRFCNPAVVLREVHPVRNHALNEGLEHGHIDAIHDAHRQQNAEDCWSKRRLDEGSCHCRPIAPNPQVLKPRAKMDTSTSGMILRVGQNPSGRKKLG